MWGWGLGGGAWGRSSKKFSPGKIFYHSGAQNLSRNIKSGAAVPYSAVWGFFNNTFTMVKITVYYLYF